MVELDVIQGIATIQHKDGTRKQVPFKIEELVIRELVGTRAASRSRSMP